MSTFNFTDYQNSLAQTSNEAKTNFPSIGFVKFKNDGDSALVRINIASTDDLIFNTVHDLQAGGKWMKVTCHNGAYNPGVTTSYCPLCEARNAGNASISAAKKRVYIPCLISYYDATTGQYSKSIPAVWDRPSGFAREIAEKIKDYGDLRNVVFKITRNGADNKTATYPISYIPMLDKPEYVPTDFSAFKNFRIDKHSFWEKTDADLNTFLTTGTFPQATSASPDVNVSTTSAPVSAPVAPQVQQPVAPVAPPVMPVQPVSAPQPMPVQQTTTTAPVQPQFGNFSF